MRILPWGSMLPVHCCCDPKKRLGWVPAPSTPGPRSFVVGQPSMNLLTGEVTHARILRTEVAWLDQHGRRRLAVKSAHEPVETWRKVAGFIEEPDADLLTTTHDDATLNSAG